MHIMRKVFTVNGRKMEFKDVIVEIDGKEEQGIRIKPLDTKEEIITLDTVPFPQNSDEASRYTEDCFYCENVRKVGRKYVSDDTLAMPDFDEYPNVKVIDMSDYKQVFTKYLEKGGYTKREIDDMLQELRRSKEGF